MLTRLRTAHQWHKMVCQTCTQVTCGKRKFCSSCAQAQRRQKRTEAQSSRRRAARASQPTEKTTTCSECGRCKIAMFEKFHFALFLRFPVTFLHLDFQINYHSHSYTTIIAVDFTTQSNSKRKFCDSCITSRNRSDARATRRRTTVCFN